MQLGFALRKIFAVHAVAQGAFGGVQVGHVAGDGAVFAQVTPRPVFIRYARFRRGQRCAALLLHTGKDGEQRHLRWRQGEGFASGLHAAFAQVQGELRRGKRHAGGFDGVVKAGFALQQGFGQAVTQADKGNFGQRDFGHGAVGKASIRGLQYVAVWRGVEEVPTGFKGGADQYVTEAVLRAPVEREGVAEIEAHGFASAGDGDVQGAVRVAGEAADVFGERVGGGLVVFGGADVFHRPALRVADYVNMVAVKTDVRQGVVFTQFVKPAQIAGKQRQLGTARALSGGDQMHFGGDERMLGIGSQGVEGFGDNLRRQTTDREQYAARVLVGMRMGVHGSAVCW